MTSRKAARWEGQTVDDLQDRWDRPQVHLYSRIDSTNSRARELAEEGAQAGTLVLADEQTSGRGQVGRRWYSPRGTGLYLSFIFRPKQEVSPRLMPLLAGLGVLRAIERLVKGVNLGLKWPNDLILDDRKLGGVLSEASWSGRETHHVVVGVGINVNNEAEGFPDSLRQVATSIRAAVGRKVSRLELADFVIREVEEFCADPPEALDREQLKLFDEYDWLRDRRCTVEREGAPSVHGTVVGVAPDGALLYRPDRGALERMTSGRVLTEELPTPDF